jgi:hypothetical protein
MDSNLKQYLVTALWSSTGEDGEPFDAKFEVENFLESEVEKAKKDWESFQSKAGKLLDGLDLSSVAHDFWLTRNRHGAGFWDGDYEKSVGEALTKLSHEFKEVDLYVGDDKNLYFS